MFEKITDENERGQVGIGTLIVFIAMVLVAAIAAGVLINTAGLLQSQAQATGEESTAQVSNSLQVQTVTGQTAAEDDSELDSVAVTVGLAPGSDAIDLEQVEITVTGSAVGSAVTESGVGFFEPGDTGSSITQLVDRGDSAAFDATELGDNGDLDEAFEPGESTQITITTADGAQTTTVINVPNILDEGASYTL